MDFVIIGCPRITHPSQDNDDVHHMPTTLTLDAAPGQVGWPRLGDSVNATTMG